MSNYWEDSLHTHVDIIYIYIYEIHTIIQGYYTNCTRGVQNCTFWTTFFFSCHLKIIRSPTTNSFISCTLFNSHITIQILTFIMMFREKFCFYVLCHFLNQTIENMVHTSYVTHNVCIWMKFAPLYKGVILTVQGKCSIEQDKCFNCTRQMF